ncbi:lung adenoma susceptibility protein 2 isoform X2 [Oryzias melastigma]|uniref:lung adenoma susceptibility protein 2 isoform X2 n=1 Tax=Oryzias melastigma TaxID=30732 RepID=UPI000CF7EE85|nr:lung adenoma susceptibility protein 2 isoform X2 [Oryzias melastigma]
MAGSSLFGEFPSPESCVTSLLSSSGHLRSSLRPSDPNTTFRYKDKQYDSASAALDAYIADFEKSGQSSSSLLLPQDRPSTLRKTVRTPRNRDVLRERLTDRELDFLKLPVSSLRHHSNRQRLSMTTDELLSIPNDGSMPVTHTSAYIQGLLTRPGLSQSCCPPTGPADRTCTGLSRSHAPSHHQSHHSAPTPGVYRSKGRPKAAADDSSCPADRAEVSERAEPSSLLHFPHWFTRNKAAMDCSDINSVPDLMYPAWLQLFDPPEAPQPSMSEPWDDRASRAGAPSWVADLEKEDDPDHASTQITVRTRQPGVKRPSMLSACLQSDSQTALRDLRLQLAEHISALAADRKGSGVLTALHEEHKIQSLIEKADGVLSLLSQSHAAAGSSARLMSSDAVPSSVDMEDLPSHRPASSLGAADEACAEAEADREEKVDGCGSHGNCILKHPGPVEALKLMLFRLQAVEAELQRKAASPPADQVVDSDAQIQGCPGSPSLQRALHHLNHLKLLVEEPRQKHPNPDEEKDKDEDEGRYSSSSAERLLSSQREPA